MKTEVVMVRKLFDCDISQKSKTQFFSATDLVKAGNKWRSMNEKTFFDLTEYFSLKSTKLSYPNLFNILYKLL